MASQCAASWRAVLLPLRWWTTCTSASPTPRCLLLAGRWAQTSWSTTWGSRCALHTIIEYQDLYSVQGSLAAVAAVLGLTRSSCSSATMATSPWQSGHALVDAVHNRHSRCMAASAAEQLLRWAVKVQGLKCVCADLSRLCLLLLLTGGRHAHRGGSEHVQPL